MTWWRDDEYLRYLHSRAAVPYGAPVQQGDVIGRVGSKDPYSTAPHLHLEHRTKKEAIPPDMSKYPVKPIDRPTLTSSYDMNRMHPILGYRRPHLGNDYRAKPGTPLKAPVPGTVERDPRMGKYAFQFHPSKTWDIKPRLRPDNETQMASNYMFFPTKDPNVVVDKGGVKFPRNKIDPSYIAPSPKPDAPQGYFDQVASLFKGDLDKWRNMPGFSADRDQFMPGVPQSDAPAGMTDPGYVSPEAPPQSPPPPAGPPPAGPPTPIAPNARANLTAANQMPDVEPSDAAYRAGAPTPAGRMGFRHVGPDEWQQNMSGLQKMGAAMMAANKAGLLPVSPWEVLGKGGLAYNQGVEEYLKNRKRSVDLQSAADMRKALQSARNPDGSIDSNKLMSIVATSKPELLARHLMNKSLIDYRNALGLGRDAKRAEVAEKLARLRDKLTRERQGTNRGDVARKAALDAAMRWARENGVQDQGKISEMARFYYDQYKKMGKSNSKPDPLGLR